jgi:NAD(P)-dependent dehydrogenase (short-subunit alcohol dehydrogenase family)
MSTKKVALISGANKGIGKEVARQLGLKGYKVYLGSRDLKRGEEAAAELKKEKIDAEAIQLDVTADASVDKAIKQLEKEDGRLDVLVNNAGIVPDRATNLQETELAKVEEGLQTNFMGPLRLTKAASALLEKAGSARVVNVSSSLGSISKAGSAEFSDFRMVGYNCSKAALNMLTVLCASELASKGVAVNSVCPGYVATDINDHQGYRTVEQGAAIIVKMATSEKATPSGKFFNDEGEIAW